MAPLPMKRAVSAGGVVYRLQDGVLEVLLCGRLAENFWALPKGTPDPGETLEETACREVQEESGVEVAIEEKIGSIRYWFTQADEGVRYNKTVHHYLMVPTGGSPEAHDWEFDLVRWFPLEEALAVMSHPNEAKMVRKAAELVQQRQGGQTAPSTGGAA